MEQAQAVKGLTKYHDNKQNITDTVYTERCIREHANFSAIQTHTQKIEKPAKWSFPVPKYQNSIEKIFKYQKGTRINAREAAQVRAQLKFKFHMLCTN